jgi:tetratricopeptide (TPR) repeat protein
MLAVAVLAVLPLTIPFFVREAGLRAVDRRELSSGRRLLAEVQQPWLGSSAILVGARAALLDGDRELAEGMLQRAGVLSGARVDFEKTLLRFRSGDTGEAVSWLTAEQDSLAAGDFRQVLEALIDGAIRGRDEQLAERVLDLWKGQTGVDVGAAAAGPLWQQAKLESWLGDLAWSRSLPDVAIVHFRRALELESGNETARLKLAELLLQYGPEEAQTHLEFLRARKPDNWDVLLRLAACYRELGESERAAGVLDELLRRMCWCCWSVVVWHWMMGNCRTRSGGCASPNGGLRGIAKCCCRCRGVCSRLVARTRRRIIGGWWKRLMRAGLVELLVG